MTKRPSEIRPEWNALQQEAVALVAEGKAQRDLPADDPKVEGLEARVAALALQKDLLAAAAWLGDARDLVDVLLLAEIVWDLHWGLGTFPQLPADIGDRDQREVAVAHLVRGVCDAHRAQASTEGNTLTRKETPARAALPRDWLRMARDAEPNGATDACEADRTEALECLVERARLGLTALRTLWNAHATVPAASRDGEDFAFGASMTFVVDEVEVLLDQIGATAKPSA
jgi:hypothetical protein